MGAYIKSTYDVQICESLNSRFSDQTITQNDPAYVQANETFIGQLRRHRNHERLFDGNHHLERTAHRLHYSLGGGPMPADPSARGRWYWLLNANSNLLPQKTQAAICAVLDQILDPNSTVQRVYFDAQVVNTPSGGFELDYSQNPPHTPLVVNGVCLMTLNCPKDQMINITGNQPDPPQREPNPETPINNVPVP